MFTVETIRAEFFADVSAAAARRGVARLEQAGIVSRAGKSAKTFIYRAGDMIGMAEQVLAIGSVAAGGANTRTGEGRAPSRADSSTSPAAKTKARPAARSSASSGSPWTCGHQGKRTNKRCVPKTGHSGQHRYQ